MTKDAFGVSDRRLILKLGGAALITALAPKAFALANLTSAGSLEQAPHPLLYPGIHFFHIPRFEDMGPKITLFGIETHGLKVIEKAIDSDLILETEKINMEESASQNASTGNGFRFDIAQNGSMFPRPTERLVQVIQNRINSSGTDILYLTARLGDEWSTWSAATVAQTARKMGVFTIAAVTTPHGSESRHHMETAQTGLAQLSQSANSVIAIPNHTPVPLESWEVPNDDEFHMEERLLFEGLRTITNLVSMPGMINLERSDIHDVMSIPGYTAIGSGEASGDQRALSAAEAALSRSHLPMKNAKGALIEITGGMDMTLFEVDDAANRLRSVLAPDANIMLAASFDEKLEGTMRVSLIASGITSSADT